MSEPAGGDADDSLIGAEGVAVSALRPGGEVEVAGRRYEASVEVGDVEAGAGVVVRRRTGFGLIVERVKR
jgi:membrane-bound serine protease (ClpP class)